MEEITYRYYPLILFMIGISWMFLGFYFGRALAYLNVRKYIVIRLKPTRLTQKKVN